MVAIAAIELDQCHFCQTITPPAIIVKAAHVDGQSITVLGMLVLFSCIIYYHPVITGDHDCYRLIFN